MKVIPLSEAKARLRQYGKLCHDEPIVVTVHGVPSFQLTPLDGDDDLVDRLIERHPTFQNNLKARLKEPTLTAAEARERL